MSNLKLLAKKSFRGLISQLRTQGSPISISVRDLSVPKHLLYP